MEEYLISEHFHFYAYFLYNIFFLYFFFLFLHADSGFRSQEGGKRMGGLLNEERKKKRKGVKRGKGRQKETSLNIFSTNCAGLKSKLQNCKDEIKSCDAGIFTLQETHFQKKGKFKMEGFEIFEAIRKKKDGGTLIGVHKGLKPMLIQEYSDKFELLVVEISVSNKDIRIISGYGPQECWPEE